jgi:hypothetical protein
VAWTAEQLAFQSLFDQGIPRPGQRNADGEDLGRGIDVIELKVLCGAAAYALAAQYLSQTSTSSLLPGLVVAALICRSIFDHPHLPREPDR